VQDLARIDYVEKIERNITFGRFEPVGSVRTLENSQNHIRRRWNS
jgi:hypothetical protein